jgi:hypothetical protein
VSRAHARRQRLLFPRHELPDVGLGQRAGTPRGTRRGNATTSTGTATTPFLPVTACRAHQWEQQDQSQPGHETVHPILEQGLPPR